MKYFFPAVENDLSDGDPANVLVADESGWPMGVAEKTKRGVLVGKARARVEIVENVAPLAGAIEGRVDDGEVAHLSRERKIGQPGFVGGGKMVAGPIDRLLGQLVESLGRGDDRGLLVVVALHHRAVELLDELTHSPGSAL